MKKALFLLIAGTVLSGAAAVTASAFTPVVASTPAR